MRGFWNCKIGTIRKLSLTHLQWRGVFLIRGTLNPDPVYFVKTKLCFRWIGRFSGCRCSPCRDGHERRRWRSAVWTSKHWRKIDWKKYFFVLQSCVFPSTNKLKRIQIDRNTATIKWKQRKRLKITKKLKDSEWNKYIKLVEKWIHCIETRKAN